MRRRAPSDYAVLSQRVRADGLLNRRRGYYLALGLALAAGGGVAATMFVLLHHSWWQIATACVVAFLLAQAGFLAHDAAHQQIMATPRGNEWVARCLSTAVVGLSYGWWMHKHSRHHSAPNQVDRDPDIRPGGIVFTPEDAAARRTRAGRWLAGRQGALFFPLLMLEGVNLHVGSLRLLASRPSLPWRRLEAALVIARLGGGAALVFVVLGPVRALVFLGVQLALFGVLLGGAFAPNHKGMPIVPRAARVDFLRRQILMSRNIRGGVAVDVLMGGLNFQIEHHLFPSMPRPNLARARPLVRQFCREMDIAYTETTLIASYAIVVRYLNAVGPGHRDPFTCPLVQQYRA